VIMVNDTIAKIEIQSTDNYMTLLRPIDTRFSIRVANFQLQLRIATQMQGQCHCLLKINSVFT